jgi:cytochrome c
MTAHATRDGLREAGAAIKGAGRFTRVRPCAVPFQDEEMVRGMDDRNNTILGWVLGAGIVALGLGSVTGHIWAGHEPEAPGYAVEGAESGGGSAAAAVPIATLMQTADVAAGEQVFKKCAACHTINQGGANGIGPNLWATMGKPLGSHAGFAYSEALTSVGGTWTFEAMSDWLESPRRFANGTKMSFAGLSNGQDRANVIAYMNAQGSNLPLPPPPAAAAPAEGEAAPAQGSAPAGAAAGGATDPAQAGAVAPAAGAATTATQPATKN